ncbi:hypothetical protein MTP03_25100 [Tsukamurella sp. PLM1]|nr:DUF305 domain-containing protein [Tsukamurella sp. PLM1]BDH57571.1 hypothetical protein MTP03_25100 [Tsukamurella sp. PLM1]
MHRVGGTGARGIVDPAAEHAGHGATGAGPSSPAANAAFNDADVDFATMMYPHHAQAVEMADLVDGKGARADVVALAAEIKGRSSPRWTPSPGS